MCSLKIHSRNWYRFDRFVLRSCRLRLHRKRVQQSWAIFAIAAVRSSSHRSTSLKSQSSPKVSSRTSSSMSDAYLPTPLLSEWHNNWRLKRSHSLRPGLGQHLNQISANESFIHTPCILRRGPVWSRRSGTHMCGSTLQPLSHSSQSTIPIKMLSARMNLSHFYQRAEEVWFCFDFPLNVFDWNINNSILQLK